MPPSDPIREKLVQEIVTRMKLINGAGDYHIALGTTIVGGVSGPSVKDSETNWAQDQGTLPALSVFDGDAISTPSSTGKATATFHRIPFLIKGFCEQGTTAATARKLIADIKTAIRQDDKWTVGGIPLAMQTHEKRDGIVRSPESFEVEGCEVEIEIQIGTKKFNAAA